MLFTITGRHFEITDRIRAHAEEKTEKLPKYYDSINQVEVIIEGGTADHGVEIIVRAEHSNVFIAKEAGEDILACIDLAVHKLEGQLRKKKDKQRNNKHIHLLIVVGDTSQQKTHHKCRQITFL